MPQTGMDPVAEWMQAQGIPLTRENYIKANWMGAPPDPWTADHEAELPAHLQDPKLTPPGSSAQPATGRSQPQSALHPHAQWIKDQYPGMSDEDADLLSRST